MEGLEGNLTIPLITDTLEWRTNATYMFRSESKDTGNPLSIIPEFTINSQLEWQATDALSANVNWTQYGRQKPRQFAETNTDVTNMTTKEIKPYSVVGLNLNYDITKNLRANAGINNLFDKRIYREATGAVTYNEPGRAYYAGVTMSF